MLGVLVTASGILAQRAVPIFVGLTQEHSDAQRSKIALNTAIAVLSILLISFIASKQLSIFPHA
ncbi:MAG: hypothetical protein JKY56_08585 [Kofleriaceae bacterium]|nr:hypothetical protein [Kofleriaceae bacterium]